MKPIKSQWHTSENRPLPVNTVVLGVNGVTLVGIWNGPSWYASWFETNPNRHPPTYWRELSYSNNDEYARRR